MRISELSERSGVTIPTLKYYLREGLLHAGELQGATRAVYDDSHLERVRLVRTLVDVGRLSIERVREVVRAIDAPPAGRHELLGAAHEALRPHPPTSTPAPDALAQVAALGLPECDHSPASLQLAHALTSAADGGWTIEPTTLSVWLGAMREVAQTDVVAELGEVSAGEALRYAIVGNVLTDPVLLALRRVAQEDVSAARFGSGPTGQP
ncbi:MerR family transcriptional regulator [Terrabacter sp. 2RAF25]|uniref:MerR family transcriptional regulator n=1 Tax=Terrabacter sp. 2RAF25 TaxID=3232998 RepID=UPI003F946ECC